MGRTPPGTGVSMLEENREDTAVLKVIVLAAILTGISFYLQHDIGINMADEGYLLYGAVQTASGKVPRLDCRGYDPGRYYWMASWSLLFGDGLSAMRLYLALFSFMGLSFGLLAARRVVRSLWGLALLGVLLTVWVFPRYHSFDIAFAMATVFFSLRLMEAPTLRRYFSAGVFAGLAAFFGRNLGLYALLALTLTALYIWLRMEKGSLLKGYAAFIGGIFVGYSPIFFMSAFIPGYFHAYLDSILFIFRHRATNIPLPVPWPWRAFAAPGMPVISDPRVARTIFLHDFFLGLLFLIMPLFYLFAVARHFFMKREDARRYALLTASLFTGIFYMHYTFSRADINHLARGIHPLIIAMIAAACLVRTKNGRKAAVLAVALFFTVTSVFTILPEKPFVKKNFTQPDNFAEYPIRGEKIWILKGHVISISTIKGILRDRVAPGESLFLAPYIPTMYYILGRESPTWNTYFLFKGTPAEEERVIRSLEEHNVKWAIVGDIPLDGRDDLRFSRTYDMVWAYLQRNFEMADPMWNIPNYVLIHRRSADTMKDKR